MTSYEFDEQAAKNSLKFLIFNNADEAWFDLIVKNRTGKQSYKSHSLRPHNFRKEADNEEQEELYDIVIGPTADDRVQNVIRVFGLRPASVPWALKRLKPSVLPIQYCFKSDTALNMLKYVSHKIVGGDSE